MAAMREHFDVTLHGLRESSFAVQAKLQSQLAWATDALEERSRDLHSEREAFEAALARGSQCSPLKPETNGPLDSQANAEIVP